MRKIILRLEGGLGNQLFQYAFARMIQHHYGGEIIFDLHTFKNDQQRNLSLHHFKLNSKVKKKVTGRINQLLIFLVRLYVKINHVLFTKIVKMPEKRIKLLVSLGIFKQDDSIYRNYIEGENARVKYINGNWMSEKFFLPVKDILVNEFQLITPIKPETQKYIELFKSEISVCVHIRRGDYTNTTWASKLLVCDYHYYENAMREMNKLVDNPEFYIFSNDSDDIEWIKKNYQFPFQVKYIDLNNSDYEELFLMSKCKHFILSNSSFSWWASYLCNYENKKVIAPSKWNSGIWDVKDIYIPSWVVIEAK